MENVSKNDFLFFQNDILKDIKALESTMNAKISQINQTIISKINEHESKITRLTDNINELLSIYASSKHDNEKIEQLLSMKRTINDSLLDCKTQINLVNRCMNNAISKYDTIIIDNLTLPGIVGMSCKFKNIREYLEFVYKELKANNLFKEQQLLNEKRYKEKLEELNRKQQAELVEVTNKTNKMCNDKFYQYEKILEEKFNLTQELVQAVRIDNSKYAMDLINKTEEIQIHYDQLKEIKKEIYDEFEKELAKFRKEVEGNTKIFTMNQNDFKLLKQRFTQLSEFIKDIRFQKNVKNNYTKMAKAIDFTKKQKYNDDYNMELYNEITKDLLAYFNSEKDEGEKEKNQLNNTRTSRRTSSVIFNQFNKEKVKNAIINKYRNSTKLELNKIKQMNLNKVNSIKKKRNSMVYQQNEFNKMKKDIIMDTPIKEEENSSQGKKDKNDMIKENNEKDKNELISFSKSDSKSSSSSPSPSLYSSKTIISSKKEKEEKKNEEKKIEEKKVNNQKETKPNINRNILKEKKTVEEQKNNQKYFNNRRGSNQVFRTIKIQTKNDTIKINHQKKGKKNNVSKIDPHIKEIKEEYGNKAKLVSMDLMVSTHSKPRYSKDELTLFNANNIPLVSGNNQLMKTTNCFSNKNLNIITNNNLFINKQSNNNSFLPNIHTYSAKKSDKMILLFQNNNSLNTYKNNNLCITDSKSVTINKDKKADTITNSKKTNINDMLLKDTFTISRISMKTDGIKHNNNNNISNNNEGKNKNNKIEYSNHKIKEIKNYKYYSKGLIVQNIDTFKLEKIEKKEALKIKKINNLAIIKTKTANHNKNEENDFINNDNYANNNDNPYNIYDLQLIENEFEKEKNQQNFIHIKEEINKINVSNEELNTKINVIEDKYSPMIDQMDEIFKLISLIYDTIKKDIINQSKTIGQTFPNINRTEPNRMKIQNNKLRNKILKDYLNKKGINLTFPIKKDNNNYSIDKNKTKTNEDTNNSLGNTDYIKYQKMI